MAIVDTVRQLYKLKKKELIKTNLYQSLLNKYNYQKVKNYCLLDKVIINTLFTTNGRQDILDITFNREDYLKDSTWQIGVCSALDIIQKDIPVYWLETNWVKMLLETDLPTVIDDLHIPFTEVLLLLPNNLIISPDNLPLDWLYFKYLQTGEVWRDIQIEGNHTLGSRLLQTVPSLVDKITWVTSIHGLIYQSTLQVTQGEIHRGDFNFFNYPDGFYPHESEKIQENIFTQKISDLIIKMLLFLQIHPEVLETLILDNSPKSHHPRKKTNIKLSPRWIKNPSPTTSAKQVSTGSHTSPKTHFRRGHMKRVPIGEGRKDRKWTWIQPTIVNG